MGKIENNSGVHSKEKLQTNPKKSRPDRYAEHCDLDWSKCDGDKPHEIKSKTKVIQGDDDGMY